MENEEVEYWKDFAKNWEETAAQFLRNTEYYTGLLDQIADIIGDDAWIADDGSIYPREESPIRAKLPELVSELLIKLKNKDQKIQEPLPIKINNKNMLEI